MKNKVDTRRFNRWINRSIQLYELIDGLQRSGDDPEMELTLRLELARAEARISMMNQAKASEARSLKESVTQAIESIRKW